MTLPEGYGLGRLSGVEPLRAASHNRREFIIRERLSSDVVPSTRRLIVASPFATTGSFNCSPLTKVDLGSAKKGKCLAGNKKSRNDEADEDIEERC